MRLGGGCSNGLGFRACALKKTLYGLGFWGLQGFGFQGFVHGLRAFQYTLLGYESVVGFAPRVWGFGWILPPPSNSWIAHTLQTQKALKTLREAYCMGGVYFKGQGT